MDSFVRPDFPENVRNHEKEGGSLIRKVLIIYIYDEFQVRYTSLMVRGVNRNRNRMAEPN